MFNPMLRQAALLSMALTTASVFSPTFAHAEPGGSGGGKVVACYTSAAKTTLKSVELLDLWEGERLPPYRKPILSNASVEKQVEDGVRRLRYVFNSRTYQYKSDVTDEELNTKGIQWTTNLLLGKQKDASGWAVDPVYDGTLPQTSDALEQVKPTRETNCEIDQVIRFEPTFRRVRINMRLFKKMNKTNQAALYLHEGLYFYAAGQHVSNEKSSIRVRRAIAYIMSGNEFEPAPKPKNGENFIECLSTNSYFNTNFNIFRDEKGLYIYTKSVAGIALFGYNKNYLRFDLPMDEDLVKCISQVVLDGGEKVCQMPVWFDKFPINNGLLFVNNDSEGNSFAKNKILVRTTPDGLHDGATDSFKCKMQMGQ